MPLVYRYYLRAPTEGADLVREQMHRAHRYYNTLIEIERGRRAAVRELDNREFAALAVIVEKTNTDLEAALAAARAERQQTRKRLASPPLAAAIKLARDAHKAAVSAMREARKAQANDLNYRHALDELNELASGLRKNAREHCGVFWGTYLLVEAAAQQASAVPRDEDPRFARWTGEGRCGVQLQGGGLTQEQLFASTDSRLRIGNVTEAAWERGRPHRRLQYTTLRMRVGSDGRAPIWASWPLRMHRPLSPGAHVTWAAVHLTRVEAQERWHVTLTVDRGIERARPAGDSVVAIDLGWRTVGEDRVRVATWYGGDDGPDWRSLRFSGNDLVLEGLRRRTQKTDDLQSIRDQHFNLGRAWLRSLLEPLDCPEWLRTATAHMGLWRSQARLAALVVRWRHHRFPGDEFAYEGAEAWRKKDKHLWTWQTHQRHKTLDWRRDCMRVFARQLASNYRWLALEKMDLRAFTERKPDEAATEGVGLRHALRLAAPGELRTILKNAFGAYLIEVDASNSTRQCHACGHTEKFDAANELYRACPKCRAVWDQDENAARNLRERALSELEAAAARVAASAAPGEKKPSRWARVKQLRQEKEQRMDAVRKAGGDELR